MYDIEAIRAQFPILERTIYEKYPLIYLDNSATTQKPRQVVEAMTQEYYNANANVHRGVHYLSQQATDLHEAARESVRHFLNAGATSEIVFTRGTTESINLVATCYAQAHMKAGDEVIISQMEHHSNIVSWQLVSQRMGIRLRVIPMKDDQKLDIEAYGKIFNERTRMVSITHMSNVLGTINPIKQIIDIAHTHDVPVLIDAAQSAPHMTLDVQALDCDFLAFSGHKTYGPTGIGVLYGKEKWLESMPPYMGGGEMIQNVSFEKSTYNQLPYKFEAGTPDYIATTGLASALQFILTLGMENIETYERELTTYALEQLENIPQMHIYGPSDPQQRGAVISFQVGNIHHLDMGTLLDRLGIAVRTGHHCAEPLMRHLGTEGTCRASFGLYNTREEINALVNGIQRVRQMF